MTCFWNSLLTVITDDMMHNVLQINSKPRPTQFIELLKTKVIRTTNVKCNDKILLDKELDENYEAIKNLDINNIRNGYLCSTCDPFLLLFSQLFKYNIIHDYNGFIIRYNVNEPIDTIKFGSDLVHFWVNC